MNQETSSEAWRVQWPRERLREQVLRGVLFYVRRHHEIFHGLSEDQVRCVIDGIADEAEKVVHHQWPRAQISARLNTWINAVVVRETREVIFPGTGGRQREGRRPVRPDQLVDWFCAHLER